MKPAMYIFVNKGLRMSPGKIAAQAAHAAVEAYNLSLGDDYQDLVAAWYQGGHYMKLIMEARDEAHLHTIERYLTDRGFQTALIIDEGRTEIDALSATALGVALVDKDDPHTAATFSTFSLFKEPRPPLPEPQEPLVRAPETPDFIERYPEGEVSHPNEPWWMVRYRDNPGKIADDLGQAKKIIDGLKKNG